MCGVWRYKVKYEYELVSRAVDKIRGQMRGRSEHIDT